MITVESVCLSPREVRESEALRYAGSICANDEVISLLRECASLCEGALAYRVCYSVLELDVENGECIFSDGLVISSRDLAAALRGCDRAVVFAATLGVELDRLIGKYGHISPARALMLDAIGTERIEALCDTFCEYIQNKLNQKVTERFSVGYGDAPLTAQKDIFSLLDCPRRIGLTLNKSLIMSPSKSVSAIVGVGSAGSSCLRGCKSCGAKNCTFRKEE